MAQKNAVVLLSGGLDSATVLAIAQQQGYRVYALSFDYGQRSQAETVAAKELAEALQATEHRIMKIDLSQFGGSALTDSDIAVPDAQDWLTVTFRDLCASTQHRIFVHGFGLGEVVEARDIFIGVNAVDYSGYPDCRPEYIAAFEAMANLATKAGVEGHPLRIHTPLIDLSKGEIIAVGTELRVPYAILFRAIRLMNLARRAVAATVVTFVELDLQRLVRKIWTRYAQGH
ncbi:MAG: 7-cyano-7-deazaguanine synthase [Pseudomonadota bacterium]|nr:MAG: 7-cyano-7-deazaguanine synthase [Pseudomonadota bacterium]